MRIVVLLQNGIPIEAVVMPDVLTRDFQWEEFSMKIRQKRGEILHDAYMKLYPGVEARKIEPQSLPQLGTYILPVHNAEDEPI